MEVESMQIINVEGIVLGETNYSESSKILKVLTKEYGIINIISKGCRSIKSKLRGVSSKLSYANFQIYYKKNGISTLTGADTINTLLNIKKDIDLISYSSYLLELTEQAYKYSNSKDLYDLLVSTLLKINDLYDYEILTYIYELKLLDYFGIKPNIDECSICGNKKNIITISTIDGGYVCQNCYHGGKIYANKTIQLIRMFIYVDIKQISKIKVSKEIKQEISEFINEYYEDYSGVYLKSREFLKNLVKINNSSLN